VCPAFGRVSGDVVFRKSGVKVRRTPIVIVPAAVGAGSHRLRREGAAS
jgi:hypothetical protein